MTFEDACKIGKTIFDEKAPGLRPMYPKIEGGSHFESKSIHRLMPLKDLTTEELRYLIDDLFMELNVVKGGFVLGDPQTLVHIPSALRIEKWYQVVN